MSTKPTQGPYQAEYLNIASKWLSGRGFQNEPNPMLRRQVEATCRQVSNGELGSEELLGIGPETRLPVTKTVIGIALGCLVATKLIIDHIVG